MLMAGHEQTVHEGRIYQLKLFCDKDYPDKPPTVRFHSRINMNCVSHDNGMVHTLSLFPLFLLPLFLYSYNWTCHVQVDPKKFGLLANWQREYSMEDILTQLRKEMASAQNRKLVQPPEGTFF